jgi:hypothetical protein
MSMNQRPWDGDGSQHELLMQVFAGTFALIVDFCGQLELISGHCSLGVHM